MCAYLYLQGIDKGGKSLYLYEILEVQYSTYKKRETAKFQFFSEIKEPIKTQHWQGQLTVEF